MLRGKLAVPSDRCNGRERVRVSHGRDSGVRDGRDLYIHSVSDFVHLATVTRGELPDTLHYGAACLVDSDGKTIWSLGDPETRAFFRSSSKPLQALPAFEALDRFAFTEGDLAIFCGSHEGGPAQTAQVRGILAKCGLGEEHLQCGNGLSDNCSGKHAGMLAACLHHGWPIENYCDNNHPLQKRIRALVAEHCDLPEEDLLPGLDGCSAPTFNLPLRNMALGFARLGHAAASAASPAPAASVAPARFFRAMTAHPEFTGEPDLRAFPVRGETPVTKGGANGLLCAALPRLGLGFALKVADGTAQVRWPVFIAALQSNGLLNSAEAQRMREALVPGIVTRRGAPVGQILLAF
jgi:L-asparaginase II